MYCNKKTLIYLIFPLLFIFIQSCSKDGDTDNQIPASIELESVNVGTKMLSFTDENIDLPYDKPIMIRFNVMLDTSSVKENILLTDSSSAIVPVKIAYLDEYRTVSLVPVKELDENAVYHLDVSNLLKGSHQETFEGLSISFKTILPSLILQSVLFDSKQYYPTIRIKDIGLEPEIELNFSHPVTLDELNQNVRITTRGVNQIISISSSDDNKIFTITTDSKLEGLIKYELFISEDLVAEKGNKFDGFQRSFYTMPDTTPKFPVIPDDELLTLVQEQTFKYFWDFGHPVSGLARERNTSGETVTIGGSGFGVMAIIVGIERGFITRAEGIERLQTIVDFLGTADRFHGAWSHWLNGTTGKVRPFSQKDDGGDLVETSFMAAGLLAVRQYLNPSNPDENALIDKINTLWEEIEWDWYTRGGQNVLYWHWSPNYGWDMNMKIQGYNEALITYIMAASSPTHPISADVYHQGWTRNGGMVNGKEFYGIKQPLGYDKGGPLFFAHYSFLGLNPRNLEDQYANYWEQNVNHTLINRAYCIDNPHKNVGYSSQCWGLTASDGNQGYSAHSPTNDRGVVTPTAALSSFPYTPVESMEALKFFYYTLGDRLWGEYGFYDAFNLTEEWTANSFLAIDQGPIVIMIENYRTGLIWDLLMSCTEVKAGLTKLEFEY